MNTRQPATASRMIELAEYLKWHFSKIYQVQRWRVFPKPVTFWMVSGQRDYYTVDVSYVLQCLCQHYPRETVGSRYFVSTANATKILFLTTAASKFLEFTGKNHGTNLEKEIYCKLQD